MKSSGKKDLIPPDGGWGWMIVLGSSIINLSTRSIEPSFGLLFGDLLKELDVATTGAAVIMSTLDAMINFSGLFVGPLIKKWSFRKVGIIGGLLSAAAIMATSAASSMLHLMITYSFVGGIGFGLATASTFVALNSYFVQKRGQAVGLAMAGTAMGFMAMPQTVSFLLTHYDFRSAVLILGAISLNSVIGASFLQPVAWHMKKPKIPEIKETKEEEELTHEELEEQELCEHLLSPHEISRKISSTSAPHRQLSTGYQLNLKNGEAKKGSFINALHYNASYISTTSGKKIPHISSTCSLSRKRKTSVISNVSHLDFMGSTMHIEVDEEDSDNDDERGIEINFKSNSILEEKVDVESMKPIKKKKGTCWSRFAMMMDFDLLKNTVYLNILFGLSITYVAELNFKMIVPFFMANLGYTKQDTAMALSMMAVADILARVIVPPILDRLSYSRRSTLMFGCVFVALSRSMLAEQTAWGPLISCLLVHGFFRGLTLINFPLVISEYASAEKFPAALGLSMVSKGCFIVILGPLVGLIRDISGSYPLCIHTQSVMILSCVVAWGIEYICSWRQPKKSEKPQSSE